MSQQTHEYQNVRSGWDGRQGWTKNMFAKTTLKPNDKS